jgi:hypothetical protein
MKPFDEQLADLSVRAKKLQDTFTAARKETHDRLVARREETRAAAVAAADRVEKDLQAAGASLEAQWSTLRQKVTSDINRLKTSVADKQVERNVHRAADRATRKENEAVVAIDFALATIEDARFAVLEAVIADREAEEARGSAAGGANG